MTNFIDTVVNNTMDITGLILGGVLGISLFGLYLILDNYIWTDSNNINTDIEKGSGSNDKISIISD